MITLETDELIGIVCTGGRWRAFAGYVAEWILDYTTYDPTYRPGVLGPATARTKLLVVTPNDGEAFCQAMEEREIVAHDMRHLIRQHGQLRLTPTFLVDFDQNRFISSFFDIAIEEYVPNGWSSEYGEPMTGISNQVKSDFGFTENISS